MKSPIPALVMAGGRGSRLSALGEKPLIKICGKPMIARVIDALRQATLVDEVIVATSKYTRMTSSFVRRLSVKVVETSGEDYHADLKAALKLSRPLPHVVISADLPLITPSAIDFVIKKFYEQNKPSLAVFLPTRSLHEMGVTGQGPNLVIENMEVTPAGVNVIDARFVERGEIDQSNLIVSDTMPFLNVNTFRDLIVARRALCGD